MDKHENEEKEAKIVDDDETTESQGKRHQAPNISQMEPTTIGAYGGGLYGTDDEPKESSSSPRKPRASLTQTADGPGDEQDNKLPPSHKSPPSSGDRGIDITGQSYIQ
ncbi:uncharacterized protein LOC124929644 [Impatiens glandulifera]|uniref:uncharacterized protein LOC124929644 n=1 Tax=Impatiens glandulifera TaxID=253017 RepID=UPI001FB168E2|nr:uncharacterized protein LOC124929644 [Impatiens glandulifera]